MGFEDTAERERVLVEKIGITYQVLQDLEEDFNHAGWEFGNDINDACNGLMYDHSEPFLALEINDFSNGGNKSMFLLLGKDTIEVDGVSYHTLGHMMDVLIYS
jgi:hypothetical protein